MAGKKQTERADKLRETAEKQEPKFRRAIKDAVATVKDGIVLSTLAKAITDEDKDAALEASKIETLKDELSEPLMVGVLASLFAGSRLGREELPATLQAAGGAFDPLDAEIQRWVRTNGARQVTQISGGSRRAIQNIIAEMISSGESASRAARQIRDVIGLTIPQQKALLNQRAAMTEAGATKAVIERTLAVRAERMLGERAFAIARNESFIAVAQGRQMYWDQLVDREILDPTTLRKWITAEDERVCPICRPMHNQVRGLNESFAKGGGGTTLTTPAHVTCRCSVILVNPRRPVEE